MKKEKAIKNSADPVTINGTKTILDQMMKCICKIKLKGIFGTGFFCKIPSNNDTIYSLMTNYHVLDEKIYKEINEINLLLNDDKEVKVINLLINRKTYFKKDYDISVIELKKSDNILNFLELDDNLFKDKIKAIYEYKSIYALQYLNGNNAAVSYGILSEVKNFDIIHTCSTENGSSGSPLLNLTNFKVIGIHKEGSIHFNYNKGTFLKFPLNDFIEKNKVKEKKI